MEMENVYEIDLAKFTIYIEKADNNLTDIIEKASGKSFAKKEWDKETPSKLIFDLISSRISSEGLIAEMSERIETLENKISQEVGEGNATR
ncbi:hypothetical protein AABD41_01705 [Staphylococcus pseudoxylosus]|uniref:hypothetical protein n=1 Tax=Staphylococcus pseudoxylosus TaxID=2282419 RepID=UPI00398AB6CA